MKQQQYNFSSAQCTVYTETSFDAVRDISKERIIIITDENVHAAHSQKLDAYEHIIIPAGEQYKNQSTVDNIIQQLIRLHADRQTLIIGMGGGVVTDIAGYTASVYMRGLKFGFIPTTILAMVDAAMGGKNGIDVGLYKNMVGIIRQPEFILYDLSFLQTLPKTEWINGFAEIIKHACIKDEKMFELLEANTIENFQQDNNLLNELIAKNVSIKMSVVVNDEFEKGDRKLLNFGHTIGHAIENIHQLPHGHAISIGMVAACIISEEMNNFFTTDKKKVITLLEQYQLPVSFRPDKEKLLQLMLSDKKRDHDTMNFILLNRIGNAVVKPIPLGQLKDLVEQCF
ncbi:MAG: 3-dehydroquinate synthase [Ferruginibacter sp.]